MTLTITDRGAFQTAAGGFITMSAASSTVSVTAGAILVLTIAADASNNCGTGQTSDLTFTITDTIADTGGGAWTRTPVCTAGIKGNLQYWEKTEIWTRVVGTSPGAAKVVTATGKGDAAAPGDQLQVTSNDGWIYCNLIEVTGQNATPIGNSSGSTSRQAAGPTTFTMTMSAPASTSAVFSVIHGDNTATVPTLPSGWSGLNESHPAWGAETRTADINTGGGANPQWTGLDTASNYLACALEIIDTASGFDIPLLRPIPQSNVTRM